MCDKNKSNTDWQKEQQQANMQRGYDGMPYSAVYYACTFPDQPFVPATPELWPTGVTWPPPNPYPVPSPEPSTTDQELGALKHRVGLLEDQMRELVEKFKSRCKPGTLCRLVLEPEAQDETGK